MKSKLLLYSAILISIASTTTSTLSASSRLTQLQQQEQQPKRPPHSPSDHAHQNQAPMPPSNPAHAAPGSDRSTPSSSSGAIVISDVIGKHRPINIFAGLTRDIDAVSQRLDDRTQNTTVLAPLNSALQAMARKPWEDAAAAADATTFVGRDGEQRARDNLRRFVEAHVVPVGPWGEGQRVRTLAGTGTEADAREGGKKEQEEIWWERETDGDGIEVRVIRPRGVRVEAVTEQVANGEVWVIQGVLMD